MWNKSSSERGQVLILLVFAMVGIFGFTALAIDGGMVYADRRIAQNAADTSALAGAGKAAQLLKEVDFRDWNCNSNVVQTALDSARNAAIQRAASNGFSIDADIADGAGVEIACYGGGGVGQNYIDVRVLVTKETPTTFAHFIFTGPLMNTVETISRFYSRQPLALGGAIVALNQDDCVGNQNGVVFHGSSDIKINGGGVFSNGCLRGDGNNFEVNVENGGVGYAGSTSGNMSNINPGPSPAGLLPEPSLVMPTPDCSSLPNRTQSGDTLQPGVYDKISLSGNSSTLTLLPGLYCVTGGPKAIQVTGGTFIGNEVTLYITTGSVAISGNAEVTLSAPPVWPDPTPAIPGLLIYLATGNTGVVDLEGNATSAYLGAVYAPDGDINVAGSNNTTPTFNTQLIGNNVSVGGNANIDINFQGSENYQMPGRMNLYK